MGLKTITESNGKITVTERNGFDLTRQYNAIVNDLEKNVFHSNHDTTDEQLNTVGKKYFGSQWGGVYPVDTKVHFDKDKKHKYYIFNTDRADQAGTHWIAIYIDQQTRHAYVFDTFDRETSKLVPALYLDMKESHFRVRKGAKELHQEDCQMDCGQRSLGYLLLVKEHGIDNVMKSSF